MSVFNTGKKVVVLNSEETEAFHDSIIKDSVKKTKGKFFSVDFYKKDGTIRHMVCRISVKKHLRGGNKTTSDKAITVYDMVAKGYRCFYPENVVSFKCGSIQYDKN